MSSETLKFGLPHATRGFNPHEASRAAEGACLPSEALDFDAVYEHSFPFVWRMARLLGVPESNLDDVVQDVFLVVHRRLEDYDGRSPIRGWLLGILHRVVADHRRTFRRKQAPCVPLDLEADDVEALTSQALVPSEMAELAEALRLATALLERLDPSRRDILVLALLEEMTVPEIADCLGLNVNTAYARLRAARKDFEAALLRHRKSPLVPVRPLPEPRRTP